MYLGIDRPEWIQLWSGAVGAFFAAVIGGLVALAVVRLTNRNQARLAVEVREKAAIADLVAGADRFLTEYEEGFKAIESLSHSVEAACIRWRMELEHDGMKFELLRWPAILRTKARQAYEATIGGKRNATEHEALLRAVIELRVAVMDWHRHEDDHRDRIVKRLRNVGDR